ncbi:TNF receptor-associated factor homolog 1b-like protein [Drosera capensis]
MAGSVTDEHLMGRSEGMFSGQRFQSGEALAEWRSSEQVENGTPSTSPPYWDSDDSDDDNGLKPSELFGKHTWKIENFSQLNKRELRGDAFEIGGYKWYILIYPQGCDVCNHLSLFLCVADHEKLLPGWSHFAQFTIAVVNKDPKKSKYSDTLHRFWKKEHDWGWKKFMELSKLSDGFLDGDTLIIRAQVQVIREKADRLFRCLDCHYRRELVRVYLTNVEQICRRYVEERRTKLGKLLEDKARWSSFCTFWLGIDLNSRRRMSKEKIDMILKVVVKTFFIEKEVTSTLVMDSLYSGLKALQGQSMCKKLKGKLSDGEDMPAPIVRMDDDMFVLADDVLSLLERAALEPLPPKDEKGPQNRTKDGNAGEDFNRDSMERDERRLTELGRRTVEIFVLAHIFSNKIEVSYQEAVALRRQEELIREEEAAWLAESELKAKRALSEKEKKSRKKQGKQKRNSRKGKDKGKDEKSSLVVAQVKQRTLEKDDTFEDASDISDSIDGTADMHQPDSDDRDTSPVNWDTDTLELHPPAEASGNGDGESILIVANGIDKRNASVMDDGSSTTSTDSVPLMNGSNQGNFSFTNSKSLSSPSRGKNLHRKATSDEAGVASDADSQPSEVVVERHHNDVSPSGKVAEHSESTPAECSSPSLDHARQPDPHVFKKGDEIMLLRRKPLSMRDQADMERVFKEKAAVVPQPPKSPPKIRNSPPQLKHNTRSNPSSDPSLGRKTSTVSTQQPEKSPSSSPQHPEKTAIPSPPQAQKAPLSLNMSRPDSIKSSTLKPPEKVLVRPSAMSRPSSAPLVPGSKPVTAPSISIVQATSVAPPLSRSVSAAGRLGPDPSPGSYSHVPQSYRNAIIGASATASPVGFSHPQPVSSSLNLSSSGFVPQTTMVTAPMFLPRGSDAVDTSSVSSSISFGSAMRDMDGLQWTSSPHRHMSRSSTFSSSSNVNGFLNHDVFRSTSARCHASAMPYSVSTSGRHKQGALADDFPHLDIINDLLDDEQQSSGSTSETSIFPGMNSLSNHLNQQFRIPNDMGMSGELGSLASSCRLERSPSYQDDGFQLDYGSGSHFDSLREYSPQATLMPYGNGHHVDGLVPPHQWQLVGPDLSLLNMRNTGSDWYPYEIPEYSNLGAGVNGYTMFRPSNGQ